MATWMMCDDTGEWRMIEAETIEDARAAAHDWARQADWDASDRTCWIDTYIYPVVDGEPDESERERVTTRFDPRPPKCVDGERDSHDWQSPLRIVGGARENPGVWGHNGGVRIHEVCMQCGCSRVTDTWAQRPDTGEQGLESVEYEAEAFADEVRAMRRAAQAE